MQTEGMGHESEKERVQVMAKQQNGVPQESGIRKAEQAVNKACVAVGVCPPQKQCRSPLDLGLACH